MNIYLVRHGETDNNKNHTYYGNIDPNLNEEGINQIKRTSEFLKGIEFNKVFISDSKRAYNTAELILKYNKGKVIKDKRINEINFGVFEGLTYKDIESKYPGECKQWTEDWKNYIPPKGESYIDFYNRISEFMKEIEKCSEDNILIVSHSGVIRTIYCYILNGDLDLFWKFSSHNGDVSLLKYEFQNWYIDYITHT